MSTGSTSNGGVAHKQHGGGANGSMQCDTEEEIPASVISSVGTVNYQQATHQIFVVSTASRPSTNYHNEASLFQNPSVAGQNHQQQQQEQHSTQKHPSHKPGVVTTTVPIASSSQPSSCLTNLKMVQPSAAPRLHPKKRKFDLAELEASPPTTPSASVATTKSATLSSCTPTTPSPSPTDCRKTSNGYLEQGSNVATEHLSNNANADWSKSVPSRKMVSLANVLDESYQPELPRNIQARLNQMSSGGAAKSKPNVNGFMEYSNGDQTIEHAPPMNDWSGGVPPIKMVSLANVLDEHYQYPSEQQSKRMQPNHHQLAKVATTLSAPKNQHPPTAGFALSNLRPPPPSSLISQHPSTSSASQQQVLSSNESMDTLDLTQWANHRVLAKQGDFFVPGCIRTAITANSILVELNHPEGATQVYHDVLGSGRFNVISDASPSVSDVSTVKLLV